MKKIFSYRSFSLNNVRRLFSTTNIQSSSSTVCAYNEWDPLEEMIVGRPDYAVIPYPDTLVKSCSNKKNWEFFRQNAGKYWADVIPEHWKKLLAELDNFIKVAEFEGIKVVQCEVYDHGKEHENKFFRTKGFYNAMPRDILTVIGDEIIQAPMAWKCRAFEYLSYRGLKDHYTKLGAKWTEAPQPQFSPELYNENFERDVAARTSESEPRVFSTTEFEACFDAADFLRVGRDVFCQRSMVTNLKGIEWMRQHLKPRGIRVRELQFHDPRPMHVDATISFVKPYVVLRNPDRPLLDESLFVKNGWRFVDIPRPTVGPDHPFYLASEWIMVNTLMRSPDAVFVEKNERPIQEMYEKLGIRIIPVPIQHMNSIGGGFHCWTVDIRRQGKLESYFDTE